MLCMARSSQMLIRIRRAHTTNPSVVGGEVTTNQEIVKYRMCVLHLTDLTGRVVWKKPCTSHGARHPMQPTTAPPSLPGESRLSTCPVCTRASLSSQRACPTPFFGRTRCRGNGVGPSGTSSLGGDMYDRSGNGVGHRFQALR